ncbi:SPFH domain-containing protein [Chryseobacterium sp. YR221]|uniref:SPFH domain-containing protein n=1 Tax=Chryseobacterium sp. YR221 TaxID=1500293 RepID=UPI0009D890F4|nr:SPFH domain-containing protein [Chryseobacterium sp. YR221]SMC65267.1 Membrane protease subunit, stomatin/prohibitin family, contains C-terminal Zn-ribbon domain [Chryseobacterium sp. YR221]
MKLFGNKREGGLMDVIRCDEQEYLVWKWRPSGSANSTNKENSIRYGSSLRVKEGELAVFFYKQNDGSMQDFIQGPHDQTIHSANFPVLTNMVGAAFGGGSPFQAEIYFINLSGNIQIRFGIPYFDMYDPRFMDLGVPCAVRGTLTFNLTDYKNFIKLNRLINFNLDDFKAQIKDFFQRKIKSVLISAPQDYTIPVMQIERKIDEVSDIIQSRLKGELEDCFGVNLKRLDIGSIELDKQHPHYIQLKRATADQQTKFTEAKTTIEIENLSEMTRIQRKDLELGVEGKHFAVHQLNQHADVLKTAAASLGGMSHVDLGGGDGLNAAGLMVGMGVGASMRNQLGGMMDTMTHTPPPNIASDPMFHIAVNGQQSGPYNLETLRQLAQSGQFSMNHHVWKEGMQNWELAGNTPETARLFSVTPPPPPPTI